MAKRHFLHRKHGLGPKRKVSGKPTVARLLELLQEQVLDRFAHMSMTDVQAVALAVSEPNDEVPAPNPSHPACLEFASTDYCHESWQLHLAKLKHRPETHWGTCQHQRICAMIPIVHQDRCLAVVKLAGPATLDKGEFKRVVDIMELLVRDFAVSQADFLKYVPGGITSGAAGAAHAEAMVGPERTPSPTHPQVLRTLEYIAAHLSDPRLTVAKVASVLDVCPTHLSEVFVKQMGQRMSRFIAHQRVEKAKDLLATTDWQIKRIALETGHANPNWFCHIFSVHTGQTPGEYRAVVNSQPPISDRQ
jgi:AraC-like DNA-binding protein